MSNRVDRMIAWLAEHGAELADVESGSVRFDFHGESLRVDVQRSHRLPTPATLARDGPSVHPAVAS